MVSESTSFQTQDGIRENTETGVQPAGLPALRISNGATSAVVSSVKLALPGAAVLPASSVSEADTVIGLSVRFSPAKPVKAPAPSVTEPTAISAVVSVWVAVWVPSLSVMVPETTFFFFNDTATTEIYALSLHDALPIFRISNGATSAVVSSVKLALLGAAVLPASSVSEADT